MALAMLIKPFVAAAFLGLLWLVRVAFIKLFPSGVIKKILLLPLGRKRRTSAR